MIKVGEDMNEPISVYTLTFQFANNYGAVLQAFALEKYLENLGCTVQIIDYWPTYAEKRCHWYSAIKQNFSIRNMLLLPVFISSQYKFSKFKKKYLNLTQKCSSIQEVEALRAVDLVIVGSDQVWNPQLLEEIDDVYYLNFRTTSIKASYAASGGQDFFSDDEVSKFSELIKGIDFVSVRESGFCRLLQNHGIGKACVNIDPVFLLPEDIYEKIARRPYVLNKGNYIVTYYSDKQGITEALSKKLSSRINFAPIYSVGKFLNKNGLRGTRNLTVEEFLGSIADADYVVNSSFHAVAFSIIFKKQFYAVNAGDRSERILSLLEKLNLKDRYVNSIEEIEMIDYKDIDYVEVEKRLVEEVSIGKCYLNSLVKELKAWKKKGCP